MAIQLERTSAPGLILGAAALPLFAGTLFLSAGLMFLVEPMVAKMVLPRLGGSPAVWTTCMVFFQAMLLAGYAYAHLSVRLLSRRAQIALHLCILLPVAALLLPLTLGSATPAEDQSPAAWLLLRLAVVAGAPMLAISATAPLLQTWFSRLDHPAARDPYFLYAASNAGSLLALLAYPLLAEPLLPLDEQSLVWSVGFGVLAVGTVLCAAVFQFAPDPAVTAARPAAEFSRTPAQSPGIARYKDYAGWTALAFVPSSLLLGVTSHITTDIASVPLLWVIPLALYLLSFVLCFARRPPIPHAAMVRALPLLLIPLILIVTTPALAFPLHLLVFFVACMVCHGALAARRPDPARLTEFYFFLALGGVLGGVFNAILAPLLFSDVIEYPLMLVAVCLAMPAGTDDRPRARALDFILPAALAILLACVRNFQLSDALAVRLLELLAALLIPALALLNFSTRRLRFALGVAACIFVPSTATLRDTIATERSFFGVNRVHSVADGGGRILIHGTTVHGAASMIPGEERLPLGYYAHEGTFGHFFNAIADRGVRHVAVLGLGSGALACYATPGQDWTFYEIDPLVERMARDPKLFRFLKDCGNDPRVVLGDGRLRLEHARDGAYDLLIVDAFGSDSVPVHLLTREAMALYQRKLAPGGLLLIHISNRSLDLAPVVAALAADAGLQAREFIDLPPPDQIGWRHMASDLVAIAARGGDLGMLAGDPNWKPLPRARPSALWTDQRSDLLGVIRSPF